MVLAGLLFLFILVLNVVMGALGYLMEKDDYDADADLQKIGKDPRRFQLSIVVALIEHGCVIALTIVLFVVFSSYNVLLGIVWTVFRTGEGVIQFYNEKNYWKLADLARQYAGTSEADKNVLRDLARTIFNTKAARFKVAMICWAIGTLAYSLVLVTADGLHQSVGWLGVAASLLVGASTGMKLAKPNLRDFTMVGGLAAILFEVIIGGWLLLTPLL